MLNQADKMVAKIWEETPQASERFRCPECGKRLFMSEFASKNFGEQVIFGESVGTLLLMHHRNSGHQAGTIDELERNCLPLPPL